ncbi:MAG: hypothetical protein ACF8R7_16095 [Phycisphaerales bacterium JB039]
MPNRIVHICALAALATALTACASKVPIRHKGPQFVQGGAWELVLPGPAVAAADPDPQAWYLTRRDDALGATSPSWAPVGDVAEARATLDRQRTIYLRRSEQSLLYFGRPPVFLPPPPTGAPRPAPRYWDP